MTKPRMRLFGSPRRTESLVRNVLLVGFLALLVLVAILGFTGYRSFVNMEEEVSRIRQTEVTHQRLVSQVSETAGKIESQAFNVLTSGGHFLTGFPSRQSLTTLKAEMDARISEAKLSPIAETPEWAEFEGGFRAYWEKVNSPQATDWTAERNQMRNALAALNQVVKDEKQENDLRIEALGRRERRKELSATVLILAVSAVVAFLTFYEIRRTLHQLSAAYTESSNARDYLRSLLDSMQSGVIAITQEGVVETVNESFRRLTGLQSAEAGQPYEEILADSEELRALAARSLSSGEEGNRYQGRLQGESGRLLDVFTSPLRFGETLYGLILIFIDVTEEVRAQTELQRNRALSAVGQMTAQIAHEIKNPLGSIRFAAEVLKRQKPGDTHDRETIGVIERSVDHLATIVTELSDYARPKELKKATLNLNELLDEIVPMVADRLAAKDMRISRQYAAQLPVGEFDVTELKKLFLNLIINAIEASEPGRSIELRTNSDGNGKVVVEIVDHGAGMDAETLRRLFEPFYTTKEKGTGLGMAIARKITELHRGELLIHSRKGQGTTATVRLPIN
ncbi:MAG TPA: ATP-binding protein [Blastocatellia bacterium]|nr:ATP-binding protein [Blastocatellia bacterium]